jgi:ATP-dependent Clp protease adaptor protein ClpS
MDSEETVVADEDLSATMVAEPKTKAERRKREVPRYNVLLWDSDDHSYEYVERMLKELFGYDSEYCHKLAKIVDTEGKVVVFTSTQELAELKRDQILAYGKDSTMRNCKGSMHATIESAS